MKYARVDELVTEALNELLGTNLAEEVMKEATERRLVVKKKQI